MTLLDKKPSIFGYVVLQKHSERLFYFTSSCVVDREKKWI